MSDWLKQLKRGAERRKDVILLYGPEGTGKSSFAAHFKDPAFVMSEHESGIVTLESKGLVPEVGVFPELEKWTDLDELTDELIAAKDRPATLVFDTINGLEALCHDHVCQVEYDGNFSKRGFLNFQEGFKASVPYWRRFLGKLDALRNLGSTIVLLAHSQITAFKNPDGADFDTYSPELHDRTWGPTKKFVDLIIFLTFHTVVESVDQTGKGKGKGTTQRMYYFERSAAHTAKHRHGLPPNMAGTGSAQGDFESFCKLILNGEKKNK